MSFDIRLALETVSKSTTLKEALSQAYFCSAITFLQPGSSIDYWGLNYYNQKEGTITNIHVSETATEVKGTDRPLKQKEPEEIDIDSIKISVDESIKRAIELQSKKIVSSIQKIFVSLYSEDSAIWSISLILGAMKIFQVKIDAKDGKIIDSKLHDFLNKNIIAK